MRRTKAYLEAELDKATASEMRLMRELADTKDKLNVALARAGYSDRVMWDMIEIMKNASKEGRLPR